jgi:FkbM family methyltransferase
MPTLFWSRCPSGVIADKTIKNKTIKTMERSVMTLSRAVRRLLKKKVEVVVEVGARDCAETVGLHGQFPGARIIAFECNPETIPLCRGRVKGISNITLVEKAVADREGEISFFPVESAETASRRMGVNPGASSIFRASGKYVVEKYTQKEIKVPVTTLAREMSDRNISAIDVLWLDIQGAELVALKGLGEKLSSVGLIHAEVEFVEIYEHQPLFGGVKAFLNERGFALYGFTTFGRYFGDAIFVNRTLSDENFFLRNAAIFGFYKYFLIYVNYLLRKTIGWSFW